MEEEQRSEVLPSVVAAVKASEERIIGELREIRDFLSDCGIGDDDVMSVRQCADYLSKLEGKPVSVGGVYNRIAARSIPHYKKGSRLWFTRSDVRAAYTQESNFVPAATDRGEGNS